MFRTAGFLSCILLKFGMHVTKKKSKWPIYYDFLHFTSIVWHCGRNNFKFNNDGGLLSSVLLLNFVLRIYQFGAKKGRNLISDMHLQNKKYGNNW